MEKDKKKEHFKWKHTIDSKNETGAAAPLILFKAYFFAERLN